MLCCPRSSDFIIFPHVWMDHCIISAGCLPTRLRLGFVQVFVKNYTTIQVPQSWRSGLWRASPSVLMSIGNDLEFLLLGWCMHCRLIIQHQLFVIILLTKSIIEFLNLEIHVNNRYWNSEKFVILHVVAPLPPPSSSSATSTTPSSLRFLWSFRPNFSFIQVNQKRVQIKWIGKNKVSNIVAANWHLIHIHRVLSFRNELHCLQVSIHCNIHSCNKGKVWNSDFPPIFMLSSHIGQFTFASAQLKFSMQAINADTSERAGKDAHKTRLACYCSVHNGSVFQLYLYLLVGKFHQKSAIISKISHIEVWRTDKKLGISKLPKFFSFCLPNELYHIANFLLIAKTSNKTMVPSLESGD